VSRSRLIQREIVENFRALWSINAAAGHRPALLSLGEHARESAQIFKESNQIRVDSFRCGGTATGVPWAAFRQDAGSTFARARRSCHYACYFELSNRSNFSNRTFNSAFSASSFWILFSDFWFPVSSFWFRSFTALTTVQIMGSLLTTR
jgi:hypothetical protein